MQLDAQEYLSLLENAHKLVFVDIEASGLRGDYNSVLCVSFKPYGKKPFSLHVNRVGQDRAVVKGAKEILENEYLAWCTYYGKGFDIPFLNTRLLKHGLPPIAKRPHVDLYYTIKHNILTARRSQGHILAWLGTPEQKMTVSADTWNSMAVDFKKNMPIMVKRCESDVTGLEALYNKSKHLVRDITR